MNHKKIILFRNALSYLLAISLTFAGCDGLHKRTDIDTSTSGKIYISVDESFKPVIDSQIQVFEALYPGAKIIAYYKPEAECLEDLMQDSIRMVIVTRGLTDEEQKFYKDSLTYPLKWDKVAFDAVALVVNNNAKDSLFTLSQIRGILDGTTGDKQIAVFDGLSSTSTVRYAIDSILHGKPFDPKKVFAAKSSVEVINNIELNDNAVGFIGVSWIGNKEDTSELSFLKKVKIASVQCEYCPDKPYTKPYQANIMRMRYPLVRGLYYILKENYNGLGGGFANFMEYEKGQLIFRRSYLWPAKMNFTIRTATNN
ncbi:MAG: substrate-binding domain-containing protein [Ginsengibacter sp.]